MDAEVRFTLTKLDTDDDGREWVCVPLDAFEDVPTALRQVAYRWDRENARG